MREEIYYAAAITIGNTLDGANALWLIPDIVRPDVTVCIWIFLSFSQISRKALDNQVKKE